MTNHSDSWLIHLGDSAVTDLDGIAESDFDSSFNTVVNRFCQGADPSGEEPTHLQTMRDKDLFDYDETGESGQLRAYPRGQTLRSLLTDFVEELFMRAGSMPVETPTMYEIDGPIKEHAKSFQERQYRFTSDGRKMMLRFASDFGHFSIFRDAYLSENQLPLSLHEICRYAFRKEQRGELVGLYRLRSFTMPDMHTLVRNRSRGLDTFVNQLQLVKAVEQAMGITYQGILRVTETFYNDNQEWVATLSKEFDRPLLIQKLTGQHSYWTAKLDLVFIDGHKHIIEGPTIQLNLETAERFDISVMDGEGESYPVLLHTSPTGSIERLSAMLLESAMLDRNPHLPAWLAPTQVRLIPVARPHLDKCHEIAEQLEAEQLRVEVDDRDETVERGVLDAEEDWASFYAVIGDDEVETDRLHVYVRSIDEEREVSVKELPNFINGYLKDYPRQPHYMPRRLSEQVRFRS